MLKHETINYVELSAQDIPATKTFFETVFNWTFTDYGPEYTSFESECMVGGFYQSPLKASTDTGSALIVFYSKTLEETQEKITKANGKIIKAIFTFPGGRRFHFTEPSGNEFAVWSDL